MTPNIRMEQLSLAYIRAVAADAGYQVSRPDPDMDSVDGILMSSQGRRPRIEFQAKATSRDIGRDGNIRFPLPVKNYEKLRADSWTPLRHRVPDGAGQLDRRRSMTQRIGKQCP